MIRYLLLFYLISFPLQGEIPWYLNSQGKQPPRNEVTASDLTSVAVKSFDVENEGLYSAVATMNRLVPDSKCALIFIDDSLVGEFSKKTVRSQTESIREASINTGK